jgi:hypothetical protein
LKKFLFLVTAAILKSKFGWDGPWVIPFLYCVRQPCPLFKMAAVTKNKNFFSYQILLYFTPKLTQILTAATWQLVV